MAKQLASNDQKAVKYRTLIEATPRVEETYRVLLNERDNQLHKYNELMQKHMEAQVAQGLEKDQKGERFTVVEPAKLPDKPAKPNRLAIMLIGIVLGVGARRRDCGSPGVQRSDNSQRRGAFPGHFLSCFRGYP